MNKVISTNNGGFPVVLNDLRFEQAATRDAFYGLLSAFGVSVADSFIISGCTIASYIAGGSYAAGYISLEGEVYKVDAGVLPVLGGGEAWYWAVDVSYDGTGLKVFENAASVDTYQVRKAKIINTTSGLAATLTTATLADKIKTIVAPNWASYVPTFAAYDSSDVVVPGGVTVSSLSAFWRISGNSLYLEFKSINISTLTGVRYISISEPPTSLLSGKNLYGTAFCKFLKYSVGGSGIPVSVNVARTALGAGDGLNMMKVDNTDFGALTSYDFRFSMAIALL